MRIFKKRKSIPAPRVPRYNLSEEQFRDMIINYETGKADIVEVLALFSYIVDHELDDNSRFNYPWLSEMRDKGIITDDAYIDGINLFRYYSKT